MNQNKESDLFPLIVILAVILLLNLITFRNGHHWGDDFSQYIAQAKSIVDGNIDKLLEVSRYRYHNSDIKNLGPILYPWGYPLLLSGVYYFFGMSLLPMKIFTNLFFLFSLPIVFFMFKDRVGRLRAFLVIIILGLNPSFFSFKDSITSDIPFMFFCLLSIFFMQRFIIEEKPFYTETISSILLGIAMFASYAVRSNGIILIPTLLLVQFIEGVRDTPNISNFYRRCLKHIVPYAVFFALVVLLGQILPSESSGSYADQLSLISIHTIMSNVIYYMKLPGVFFTQEMSPFLTIIGRVLYLVSFPFVCFGVIKTFRQNYLYLVFMAFTIALYVVWPGVQGIRFIYPVLPFYLFFLFVGLCKITNYFRMSSMKRHDVGDFSLIFGIAIALIFGVTVFLRMDYTLRHRNEVMDGPYSKDSVELFENVKDRTRSNDIIVFFKPRAMTLYSDRKAIALSSLKGILLSDASYVACKRNDDVDMALQKNSSSVDVMFRNASYVLYKKKI